jgi:hypothetical protein
MKKHSIIVLVALMISGILFSCKKDSTSTNNTASIKDKTWWGQFFYTAKPIEYYAIHFNSDGSLTWSEYSGDYPGKWSLDGSQLTISFNGTARQFKATISGDNKLVNVINTPANGYSVVSGELVPPVNNTPLENTIWKGSATSATATVAMQMTFKPGFKTELRFGTGVISTYSYTMSAENIVMRIGTGFFGIVTSTNEMKGSVDNAGYLWQTVKQ